MGQPAGDILERWVLKLLCRTIAAGLQHGGVCRGSAKYVSNSINITEWFCSASEKGDARRRAARGSGPCRHERGYELSQV